MCIKQNVCTLVSCIHEIIYTMYIPVYIYMHYVQYNLEWIELCVYL